jgi:hypothetical protein
MTDIAHFIIGSAISLVILYFVFAPAKATAEESKDWEDWINKTFR